MGDSATLREVCAAQRDRVIAATATPVPKLRTSPYSKLSLPNSLRRLAPSSFGALPRVKSNPSEAEAALKHELAGACSDNALGGQGGRQAGKQTRGGSRFLCCGGNGPFWRFHMYRNRSSWSTRTYLAVWHSWIVPYACAGSSYRCHVADAPPWRSLEGSVGVPWGTPSSCVSLHLCILRIYVRACPHVDVGVCPCIDVGECRTFGVPTRGPCACELWKLSRCRESLSARYCRTTTAVITKKQRVVRLQLTQVLEHCSPSCDTEPA